MIAGADAGHHRRGDRAGAAAEHQAIFGAFERGDFLAQDFDGRIVAARVRRAPELVAKTLAERRDGRETRRSSSGKSAATPRRDSFRGLRRGD